MQASVKDTYMKVIESTIENARADFEEKGTSATTIAHLETLGVRWRERLLQTQDFSEDPALMRGGGGGSSSRGTARTGRVGQIVSVGPAGLPASIGGGVPGMVKPEAIPGSASAGVVGNDPGARGTKRKGDDAGPPSKRARRPADEDDGEVYKDDSDLGSSSGDSDIQSAGSDPEVDNFILAQHDRVRKGGKWKVQLKEGIAHINGRDYLFNRATCDLEW